MTILTNIKFKYILAIIFSITISIVAGVITNDLLIGGANLATGILCAYFASEGKRINYIFGILNTILIGYVSFCNNLYGTFFFYIVINVVLQVIGFLTWKNNIDNENNLSIREFNLKISIITISSCIIGSFILGYFLCLIPSENLAFLDASSNCINICGIILMNFRFKECWWVFLGNNMIDLIIWAFMVKNNGIGSVMMLLVSIAYLVVNIYGIVKWQIEIKREIKQTSITINKI